MRSNVHLASRYPPNTAVGASTMRAVPGHEGYVLYPYEQDYATSAERCRKMGERCGVAVEVEFEENTRTQAFWKLFKEREGGISGTEGLLAGSVAVDESLERGGRQDRGLRRQSGATLALHSGQESARRPNRGRPGCDSTRG